MTQAKVRMNMHDRDYHHETIEQPVSVAVDRQLAHYMCGYKHCHFVKGGHKDSKRDERVHMSLAGTTT
eukprot:scaffold5198_cov173-Amphora_coffeaeformis.AAC.14